MDGVRLGENIGMREELIIKVCSMAMKSHKSAEKLYISKRESSEVVFSFPGSWSVDDWFRNRSFGEVDLDPQLFPSLNYIGLNEVAKVNEAFLSRFKAVLANQQFKNEVTKAVTDRKRVVFTGHSLGGPIAILATVWFLELHIRPNPDKTSPRCVTFGSPLVGDRFMNHSLRRENWSRYFTHFIMRYDIVPRISLSPLSSIDQQLQRLLSFFNPKSHLDKQEILGESPVFFVTVMRNAASVASHDACKIMGSTNPLLETLSSFVELSPYRPFGTYVFCTGNEKLVVITNPNAVLQVLFYSCQLNSMEESELQEAAQRSLKDHINYNVELQSITGMQSVTYLNDDQLEALPLSSDAVNVQSAISIALNDLGLGERPRLCLRAAKELENQKSRNEATINRKRADIEKALDELEEYKRKCALRQPKVCYYDAFKISEDKVDFDANVTRLKLAGILDELVEMLKRYELPGEFEGKKVWVDLGTRYRRLVEPLDISNYYRHLKNEDTGPYMKKGRPKRYKCTQRWREHAEMMPKESSMESCFWAEVEELHAKTGSLGNRASVLQLLSKARKWVDDGDLGDDVFVENSTFNKLLAENNVTYMDQDLAFQGS